MKTLNFFIDSIEWLLFIALLCIAFIMLSPLLPTNKYLQTFIVPTGSMEPTIRIGSVAIVQVVKPETLQKGTIIAFTDPQNPKIIILHRIIAVTNSHNALNFKTKGDNNNGPDAWEVGAGLVKGKMLFAIPYIGYLGQDVRTLPGFILIIIIPAIILVLLQIKRIKIGIEEEVVRRTKKITDEVAKTEIMSVLLLLLGITIIVGSHYAQYSYASYSSGIHMHAVTFTIAKENAGYPTPTVIPTQTPKPTTSPTPGNKPETPCNDDTTISLKGNGTGSNNTVSVSNTCTTTITQSNKTISQTIITSPSTSSTSANHTK